MNENTYDYDNIEDIFPLSDIQMGMIYESLIPGTASVYYNQVVIPFRDNDLNFDRFRQAISLLVDKHPMLRTGFNIYDSDEPVQVVYKKVSLDIEQHQISDMPRDEQEKYMIACLQKEREKFFDISRSGPLWRIRIFQTGKGHIYFAWINHHAIHDGWSFASFMTELNNTYLRLQANPHFVPTKLKSTYKNFIIDQLLEKKNIKTIQFWKHELSDYKRFDIPKSGKTSETIENSKKKIITRDLGMPILEKLTGVAKKYNTSLRHICFAAYVYTLNMISYENDFVVGMVNHNRPECEDGEKIIGCFLNEVPVRVIIPDHMKWSDFITMIDRKLVQLTNYNKLSLFEIAKIIGAVSPGRNPIFDTTFNYMDFFVYNQLDKIPQENKNAQGRENDTGNIEFPDTNLIEANTPLDFGVDVSHTLRITLSFFDLEITEEMGEKLCRFFINVITHFINEPEGAARKEKIIDIEERKLLLVELNDTGVDFPQEKPVHELFAEQVERMPDNISVIDMSLHITYRELDNKSGQLANILRQKGIVPDTIVAIMVGRSLEMITGIFGILKSGGAYLPIDPGFPEERIDFMLKDSNAKILINKSEIRNPKFESPRRGHPIKNINDQNTNDQNKNKKCHEVFVLNFENLNLNSLKGCPRRGLSNFDIRISNFHSSNLCYVIYTSGSTGKPKGVMIDHTAVHNFIEGMRRRIEFKANKRILALTTISFDIFGLEILLPFSCGMGVVMANENHQQDIPLLENLILSSCVDMLQATPTRMQMFVLQRVESSCLANLKEIMVGGEAFPVKLLEDLKQLTTAKIYNMYGPTETTIWSTVKDLTGVEEITIGKPIINTQVYILDKYLEIQPVGVPGEMFIGGAGVARGYLNRPELTSEKFDQDLWDVYDDQDKKKKEKNKSFSGGAGGRLFKKAPLLYRTGDLARWLPGGEIEFLGRIDYQVKIRGVRIELEEIENLLLTFPGIKEACVICKTDESGNNNLCAYIISNEEVPVPGIRKHLLKHLPGYMIPVHFVFLEKMPLTPNGKIDRKALPDPEIKIPAGNIAPRNQTEKALAEVWSEVLGIEKDKLGIDANFFELGGHSLKAIILSTRIHKKLNIKVPLAEIFKSNTIRSLSGYIKESGSDTYTAIEIAEKREYYPLSNAQKGIFVQHHKEAGALVYNMSQILTPDYDIDPIQLTNALQKLAARHESLRTSFRVIDGQPVQVIHSQVDLNIEYYESDYSPSAINSIWHRFIKPFDLTQAPLFRVALVTGKTKKRLIMVDIHHIITDWVSTNIALKEMTALYNGNELPPITVNYKDFCIWQNRSEEKEKRKKQGEFWQHQFSGNIPVLKMPYDCERPPKRSFQGEQIKFAITEDLCVKLDEINRETGATVNMMLLAIFSILLAKYSWQEDIIIGTPAANRNHTDLENIIGVFINMLAIRNRPQKDKTFHGFLLEVKEQVLDALSNQDYHFEELVAALGLQGDVSRNPLFDVVFVMQDREVEDTNKNQNENNKPGIIPDEIEFTNSPFDLILGAAGNEKRIDLTLAYSTALYKRAAVEKMAGHYLDILRQVADNYHIIINDIQVSDIRIAPDNKMDKKDLAEFEF